MLSGVRKKYSFKIPDSKRLIPMTEAVREAFLLERVMQEQLGVGCDTTIDGYSLTIVFRVYGAMVVFRTGRQAPETCM